jgi:hypothetical protein
MIWSEDDPYLLPPTELAKTKRTALHPRCADGVGACGGGVVGLPEILWAIAAGRHGGPKTLVECCYRRFLAFKKYRRSLVHFLRER